MPENVGEDTYLTLREMEIHLRTMSNPPVMCSQSTLRRRCYAELLSHVVNCGRVMVRLRDIRKMMQEMRHEV